MNTSEWANEHVLPSEGALLSLIILLRVWEGITNNLFQSNETVSQPFTNLC